MQNSELLAAREPDGAALKLLPERDDEDEECFSEGSSLLETHRRFYHILILSLFPQKP